MKITPQQWIEVVKLISTFIIGLITALCIQSCTASMSVFWKNSNSNQESHQKDDGHAYESPSKTFPFS